MPDGLEVLDGAVDEAAVLVAALDRRHEWRGTGGQHQRVVPDRLDATGVGERLGDVAGGRRHVGDRAAGTVSFRFSDGSQRNGVPIDEAVELVTKAIGSLAVVQTAEDLV